jgi:hypothetical protein
MNYPKPIALVLAGMLLALGACAPEIIKRTVEVTGPATLEVGKSSAFKAVLKDSTGKIETGKTFIWSSSDPTKATVEPATGVVTALKTGTVSISAATEGQTGKASLKLVDLEVTVTGPALIELGKTGQYTATVKDSDGNTLSGKPITWSSSEPLFASVDTAGLVTARGIGSFTVSATVEGRSGKSASARTYGLEAKGGTYVEAGSATVGTVVVRKLRGSTGAVVETLSTGTLTGPSGWNNSLPINLSYEASRSSSSEIFDKIAAVTGTYQASVTVDTTPVTASFSIDVNQKLTPTAITPGALSPTSVALSWTAVAGAKSYTVSLRQAASGSTISSATFDNTITSHTFSGTGLGLTSGGTYRLEVRASTRSPESGDPLPGQVNISSTSENVVIP